MRTLLRGLLTSGLMLLLMGGCGGGTEAPVDSAPEPQVGAAMAAPTERAAATAASGSAFKHPGVLFTKAALDAIKADLNKEPWKSAYSSLAADANSSLSYQMQGPFATVTRNPNLNRDAWLSDMAAVYNMARMWYFTGNGQYAQKAHDILLAWARTQKSFGGAESAFDIGDSMCATAADILRGTWSGWTSGDTTTVQGYFANVLWPSVFSLDPLLGGSQGMEQMTGALAIAIFNDDQTKFNQVLSAFLTDPGTGLRGSLSTGEVADTGRDQGHTSLYVLLAAEIGQMFWNQGVDVFSLQEDRILAMGEYYARYNLPGAKPAYVPFGGPAWGVFTSIGGEPRMTKPRTALNILHTAYAVRKGVSVPWVDLFLADEVEDINSFMFRRSSDTSTATAAKIPSLPPMATLTTGLTKADLSGATPAGSGSYASGAWTLSGGYSGANAPSGYNPQAPYSTTPSIHFEYKPVTGDFTMVAKVVSVSNVGNSEAQAGIMIRDVATARSSYQTYIAVRTDAQYSWSEQGTAASAYNLSGKTSPLPRLPYWIKIERVGKRVNAFTSPDGTSWASASANDFPNMPATAYVGLFATSLVNGQASKATFTNVAITGGDDAAVSVPSAPYSMLAAPAEGAVVLRWNAAFGASTYHVLRATSRSGSYSEIASVSATTYTDTSVTNGTPYYYVVTASNSAGTSPGSPQDSATPARALVNVAFGGTANASSSNWDGPASNAFDTNPGSPWHAYPSLTLPQWLQYDFGQGVTQTIERYGLTSSYNTPSRNPSAWQLQGSQNGSDWVTLDSRSGQTFAYQYQTRYYDISNKTSYRFYRLYVTGTAADQDVEVSELNLFAASGHLVPNGTYRLLNRSSNLPAGVAGGSTSIAARLELQADSGSSSSQQWTFSDQGGGKYKIIGVASGLAMDVIGASTSNGTSIDIWPWNGGNQQLWTLAPTGGGNFNVTSVNSAKVIDASGGGTVPGTPLIQWQYGGGANQQWLFVPTQ